MKVTGPLLAVFAHPDDESFGTGGTLARYAAAGVPVTVLTATRGERSTLGTSGRYAPTELAALREQELRCAARALGVAEVRLLGYPDGGLSDLPPGRLAADIGAAIAELRPGVVITFDVGGITGHPDHIAVARATTAALAALAPAWPCRLYYWALPARLATSIEPLTGHCWVPTSDVAVDVTVDTTAFLARQQAAIACHKSQSEPLPVPLVARLAAQSGHEYFVLALSTVPDDRPSPTDLFG